LEGIAQTISYAYDNAGNRISRTILLSTSPQGVKKAEDPVLVEYQIGERKITVYPNPTKGKLAVEITGGNEKPEHWAAKATANGG